MPEVVGWRCGLQLLQPLGHDGVQELPRWRHRGAHPRDCAEAVEPARVEFSRAACHLLQFAVGLAAHSGSCTLLSAQTARGWPPTTHAHHLSTATVVAAVGNGTALHSVPAVLWHCMNAAVTKGKYEREKITNVAVGKSLPASAQQGLARRGSVYCSHVPLFWMFSAPNRVNCLGVLGFEWLQLFVDVGDLLGTPLQLAAAGAQAPPFRTELSALAYSHRAG